MDQPNKNMMEAMRAHFEQEKLRRVETHHRLNQFCKKGQIVMAGSSLMEFFPVVEMAEGHGIELAIYNRGISGDTLDGQLGRMQSTFWDLEPSRVFINIGTNDISAEGYKREVLFEKYAQVLGQIKERLPECRVYVLAYYPVNRTEKFKTDHFRARTNEELAAVNAELPALAARFGYEFIDLFTPLRGPDGNLPAEVTMDGMHMYPDGYKPVFDILLPYFK